MKVIIPFLLATFGILSACTEDKHSKAEQDELPAAYFEGQLPGYSIVKMQELTGGQLAVLAEKLVYDLINGNPAYRQDHQRVLFIKQGNEWQELALEGQVPEDTFLTDIVRLGTGNEILVSAVNSPDFRSVRHKLLRVNLTTKPSLAEIIEPEDAQFPEVELDDDGVVAMKYMPWDTLDISNLAMQGNTLMLLARNSKGTLYVERFSWNGESLKASGRRLLSSPVSAMRIGMTGGSYDVMGQLISKYRVHGTFQDDGRYVALSLEHGADRAFVKKYGEHVLDDFVDKRFGIYASILTLNPNDDVEPKRRLVFYGSDDDPLHGVTRRDASDFLVYGSNRDYSEESNGRASPRLIVAQAGSSSSVTLGEASASIQAALCLPEKACVLGGSWQWTQNPNGLSIAGGNAFVAFLGSDLRSTAVKEKFLDDTHGEGRSEVRDLKLFMGHYVCAAGMMHGPDTHSGDQDGTRIVGDGFIRCMDAKDVPKAL